MSRNLRVAITWSSVCSAILLSYAFIAESDAGRGSLVLVAGLASVLVSASVAAFALWLRPRLGVPLSTAVLGLVWFSLAVVAALTTPLCHDSDVATTCAPNDAVAAGYPFLLIPPVVWLVASSARLLFRALLWALTLPQKIAKRSRRTSSSTPTTTPTDGKHTSSRRTGSRRPPRHRSRR